MVVTYQDEPIDFAARKFGAPGLRVAHEVWVDVDAPRGLGPVATSAPWTIGTRGHPITVFQTSPDISLVAGELTWFEKDFASDGPPLELA